MNEKLPDGEKIRLVSLSGNPTEDNYAPFKNGQQWNEAVERAQQAGILVIDARDDATTGFVGPAYYSSDDRESPAKCRVGYPGMAEKSGKDYTDRRYVLAPASQRTVAEEYIAGKSSYTYYGRAGLSWAIPYAAGVLALGWQVNPELGNEEIVELLRETACVNDEGGRVIDPVGFIEAVRRSKNSGGVANSI